MSLTGKNFLAIDDTRAIRSFLGILLQAKGAHFFEAGNADDGLRIAQDIRPDVIVLDLGLPDKDGLEILADLKNTAPDGKKPIVIILSVRKDPEVKRRAMALGADAYLSKPFLVDEFIELVSSKLGCLAVNKAG